MHPYTKGGAIALLPLLLAQPVFAQDTQSANENTPIVVTSVSLHPAAGLMNEHMHDGGELMLGLRYTHGSYSGANQSGTETVADSQVLAAGYTVRAQQMTMDMVMLDIMYAPTNNLTLMVMPHWMRHEMTMVGIDPANTGEMAMGTAMTMEGGHAHHGLAFGQTMTHSTQGMGDTLVSASLRLANERSLKAHATLGLWLPTGKIDRMNADGSFVHYGMQSGSGTWDIEPSATVSGQVGSFGWGAQASYRWRTDNANASGFAFGDKAMASGWVSWLAGSSVSLTSRLAWEHEGAILGHYSGAHNHAAPPDRQANYGGDTVLAAVGANFALPIGGAQRPQIGIEAGLPLYQNLNGIQVAEDWRMAISLSQAF